MSAETEVEREEPKKRGAKSQYAEEMFERVRARVAEGMPVPTAIQAAGMCVSQFYAAVAEHQEWKVALQKARLERRVERLEDESCRRIFIGDPRPIFWKGERVGEIREPAIGMLIFMMKTLSPERYANTKAAAKRRAQLDGLEASRARVLVNAQRGVKIMQGHYRAYLQRCGVPVPPGDSEQLSVNSNQSSGNGDQASVNSNQSSATARSEEDAAGQKGNLTLDHDPSSVAEPLRRVDLNHDLVLSSPATVSPASGKAPPPSSAVAPLRRVDCTHGASGAEDTAETGNSGQKAEDSGQFSGENTETGEHGETETGQWGDFDPDDNSEPKLPPPYEPWWRPGMDVTVTMLEDEAYRLAIEGVVKPIFQQGTEVGERRVRSERLLQFLLIASAFKKYGRREVGPLQAEEEPGRPEFMAKLNAIYGQDEELHRKFTEVFERNNARRHAERLADLERKNRGSKAPPRGEDPESKAPPCTHGASGAEDTETGRRGDTATGQKRSDQRAEGSGQPSATARRKADAAGQKGNLDLDLAHDLDQSGETAPCGADAETESKAPPPSSAVAPSTLRSGSATEDGLRRMDCTHSASGAEDTAGTGLSGSEQLSVSSNQSTETEQWDVLDFEQFSAAVAASRGEDAATGRHGDTESKTPPCSKAPPCTHSAAGAEDAETPRSATSRGCLKTPEYPESGGQSHAQMTASEKITKQENAAAGPGGSKQLSVISKQLSVISKQSSVISKQSSVTAAGQRGHLTHDHDLNHNLVLSGPAEATPPGPAANEPAVGTAENQEPTPEHDASWYSPSARAARITQSMIEHRLRRRRVEM